MKYVREIRLPGSFTLEAAGVMAMVFFSVSAVMGQAGKLHDETAGSMVLHEAVEKARHERDADPREVGRHAGNIWGCSYHFRPMIFRWRRRQKHMWDREKGENGADP